MKTIYKNIAMAVLALSAVACSQDDDFAPTYHNDPNAVRITAQVNSGVTGGFTRSNPIGTDDKSETEFNVNDKIGVSAGTQMAVTYMFDGTNWDPQNGRYLSWEDETMNFKAWYPATSGTDTENFKPSYSDTPTLEELAANDYMTFEGSVTRTDDNKVSLVMQRQMVRVVIDEIVYNSQFNETTNPVTSIKITTGRHIFSNGGCWMPGNISAQMYNHTDGKWYAVLPPNPSAFSGDEEETFLEITVAGESTPLIVKGLPITESGNSYSYTLTIGKEKADVADVDMEDWTGDVIDNDGNHNVEEFCTFDATNMEASSLKTEMIAAINKNIKTFIITMPDEADESMFTALCEALTIDGISNGSIDLTLAGVTQIPDNAFCYVDHSLEGQVCANSLKSVTLPDVTGIGESAFTSCEYMSFISAPEVLTVEDDAFSYCEKLATVDMPKVQKIGYSSLSNCGFTEILLPEVTDLGNNAFSSCEKISKISLPKVQTIGYYAFQGCAQLTEITFGALTSVDHQSYGIFHGISSDKISNIALTLSSAQKVMVKGDTKMWTATEDDYKDSEDYTNAKFMGYQFKSVTLQ